MAGCSCNFNWDFLALFREEILQCVFPTKRARELAWQVIRLERKKQEIKNTVAEKLQIRPDLRCRGTVNTWLADVENAIQAISPFQDQETCCSCAARHSLGGSINEDIRRINELLVQADRFDTDEKLFEESPPSPIKELQRPGTVVGTAGKLEEIRACLRDGAVSVVGIYGPGGVGKTTLMEELNNKLLKDTEGNEYDRVIYVVVSQDVDIYNIQKTIGDRLNAELLQDPISRRDKLLKILGSIKFLILLDDLWKGLDLLSVGIPVPDASNNRKIVFTTRLESVCRNMNAQRDVKVDLLDKDMAWELFRVNLGPNVDLENNQVIRECAATVVSRCRGLPLALIVIAKAFGSYRNNVLQWKSGRDKLMNSPADIEGMEDNLLSILRFSFDNLTKDMQSCLLYCSLYPYDCDIPIKFLEEQWFGEGILGAARGRIETFAQSRRSAFDIISGLRSASLLEPSLGGDFDVKMHDSVRDMCLWITGSGDPSNCQFLTYNTIERSGQVYFEHWVASTKVSFIHSKIQYLEVESVQQQQQCPVLKTLLLNDCHRLTQIHHDFFQFVPALRVLDLTKAPLKELPTSIFCLAELTYLNLKGTQIEILPKELGKLTKLGQLYLEETLQLRVIPKEALSTLSSLRCLSVLTSNYLWGLINQEDYPGPMFQVDDAQNLLNLEELGLNVQFVDTFYKLCQSKTSIITELSLLGSRFNDDHVANAFPSFLQMRRFWITDCNVNELLFRDAKGSCLEELVLINNTSLTKITVAVYENQEATGAPTVPQPILCSPLIGLRVIYASGCHLLENLSCVRHTPYLETIRLYNCEGLTEILPADDHQGRMVFNRLQKLIFQNLPNLITISNTSQSAYISFETLLVTGCPKLTKLPFDLESSKNMKDIRGSRDWWRSLEWDSEEVYRALDPHFRALS